MLFKVNNVPGIEHGFKRAVSGVLSGFVLSALIVSLVNTGLIPPLYLLAFKLLISTGITSFIRALPYWGTGYILGWLLGYTLMLPSGIIDLLDFAIFIIIPSIVLCLRLLKRAQE